MNETNLLIFIFAIVFILAFAIFLVSFTFKPEISKVLRKREVNGIKSSNELEIDLKYLIFFSNKNDIEIILKAIKVESGDIDIYFNNQIINIVDEKTMQESILILLKQYQNRKKKSNISCQLSSSIDIIEYIWLYFGENNRYRMRFVKHLNELLVEGTITKEQVKDTIAIFLPVIY